MNPLSNEISFDVSIGASGQAENLKWSWANRVRGIRERVNANASQPKKMPAMRASTQRQRTRTDAEIEI